MPVLALRRWSAAAAVALALAAAPADAASIRVSPIAIDLRAPATASAIHMWNEDSAPVSVQVRVFRWTQVNGEDVLTATTEVAVSPPIVTIQPGAENIVRVIRTAGAPTQGEASYRVLVDQLPDPLRIGSGAGVSILVQQSLPVFFAAANASAPDIDWAVRAVSGGYRVTATNTGQIRLRVANLVLSDSAGHTIGVGQGLVGYALGGSTVSWVVPRQAGASGAITLSGESNRGPINASVTLQGG